MTQTDMYNYLLSPPHPWKKEELVVLQKMHLDARLSISYNLVRLGFEPAAEKGFVEHILSNGTCNDIHLNFDIGYIQVFNESLDERVFQGRAHLHNIATNGRGFGYSYSADKWDLRDEQELDRQYINNALNKIVNSFDIIIKGKTEFDLQLKFVDYNYPKPRGIEIINENALKEYREKSASRLFIHKNKRLDIDYCRYTVKVHDRTIPVS